MAGGGEESQGHLCRNTQWANIIAYQKQTFMPYTEFETSPQNKAVECADHYLTELRNILFQFN